jgi:RPA family protein
MRLMWADEHGVKTRSVRQEDIQTVKEAIEQYHEFKDIRRKLRIEEKKLEKLLGEFERKTTLNSKSNMGYL